MVDSLVSVIVPIYKVERFLRRAIDSVIEQKYRNLEIILVDDGSPDACPDICDEYKIRDERIRVIHKRNGGLSSARNAGIDIATGKYIAFLDADDILNENYIRILYDICEKYDCDIAQCDFLMINEDSILLKPQQSMKINIFNTQETMKDFCKEIRVTNYWVAWNKLYRRELFDDIRYPLKKIHEDIFTSHKLLWKSHKTAVTNLYLYYYLQRQDSITGGNLSLQAHLDNIDAIKEELEFFKEKELEDEYIFMLYKYYFTLLKVYENVTCELTYEEVNSNYTNILNNLRSEAIVVRETILKLPQEGMLTKIRCIYHTLSPEEKESYKKVYGSRISETFISTFGFPVEKVGKNSRIALYGAGKVGQSYYDQIKENDYGEVVVWVDNAWKNHIRWGLPVQSIDTLFKCDFDKLIIAIQNREVVEEVKDNLISWGINKDKIVYELPIPVDRGSRMRTEFIEETQTIKFSDGNRRWIIMNAPDHNNLGDHLLTMGTVKFVNDLVLDEEVIEITGRQWDACKMDIIPKISIEDIIVIVGGGFMGDLWPGQDGRVKQILQEFSQNKIIFFPQTFYYINDEKSNSKSDIEIYNKKKDILFLHREKNSYRFFTENIVKDLSRNKCFPDLALYLDNVFSNEHRRNILFCLRLDKESINDDLRNNLLNIAGGLGKSVELIDTVLDKSVTKRERQDEVSKILNTISKAELLITDRLHAMIMAVITGTPCIAFDNLSKKVSGVYEWIKDLDYVTCIKASQINIGLIQNYIVKGNNKYDKSTINSKFIEMGEFIKTWVKY